MADAGGGCAENLDVVDDAAYGFLEGVGVGVRVAWLAGEDGSPAGGGDEEGEDWFEHGCVGIEGWWGWDERLSVAAETLELGRKGVCLFQRKYWN